MFVREDWTLFRTLSSIGQKAGVAVKNLPRLLVKELVDNALDACGHCSHGRLDAPGGFYVEDAGEGIPGTNAEVAELFSIARPLTSSKLLRLPTRGALGNGLRVVAGCVLASGGTLRVATRGRVLNLTPKDDGHTLAVEVGPQQGGGTRVEVVLGAALQPLVDDDVFDWAEATLDLATGGPSYAGRSSPWWYDSDSFFELCRAAGVRSVRDLVAELEGCSGAKAGKIAVDFLGRAASSLSREEAETLLAAARKCAKRVRPQRLGYVGKDAYAGWGYARTAAVMTLPPSRGTLAAEIPLTVEVWAAPADFTNIRAFVNRTCVAAELSAWKKKTDLWIRGCGLGFCVGKVGRGEYCIDVNVQTPYMPITTDGKEPDFGHFGGDIQELVGKAVRRGRRNAPATARRPQSQKQIILDALPAAIAKASGDGEYRFSIRQLFYAVRPYLLTALEQEPSYDWFAQVITDHEAETGADIPGIYRDSRGTLYHPHTHTEIPLGTLAVEKYRRPSWTFNKVLYCEKEGFFPILRAAQWPERHDCALLTSKGFASRAARDVLDLLGKTDEPLTFFCIHDADGPGTMIYEALQEGTRARPGRQVKIINLGLEVEEALEMKLQIEPVERKGNRNVTVAGYVAQKAREWLQEHRVELNAMPTPDFIAWLERKIAKHSAGKVLPPPAVTEDTLRRELLAWLRRRIRRRVLRRARVGRRAQAALARREVTLHEQASALGERILADLQRQPTESWLAVVRRVAEELGAGGVNVTSPPA